jgi:SAM-dependent methyltransferase
MQSFYPESRFAGFTTVDGTIAFYARVQALTHPDSILVDFGCGRGAYINDPIPFRRNLRIFKGKVRRVIGLDVGSAGANNPFLDEFHCLSAPNWPLEQESVDLVVCDNVLEHLPDPQTFFIEARRVLKPSGMVCIRTPNRWNYIALLSRLLPGRSRSQALLKAKPALAEEDAFPTFYRCNTLPALRRALSACGFDAVVCGYEAEPTYLSFSRFAYAFGVLHQKLAPGMIRAALFACGQKKQKETISG